MLDAKLDEMLCAILKAHPDVSDINFTVGKLIQCELSGKLREIQISHYPQALQPENTREVALAIIGGNERLQRELDEAGACDCAVGLSNNARFRVNIFKSRGHHSIVLRALAARVPNLDSLGLPEILDEIPKTLNGLVLVTGATGSGKSTTLAAIVDKINETRPVHIVTLEDPIEFTHSHKKGTVNQRELGPDYQDFAAGLRAALRQAPKVILVGEIRDRESMDIALKASETGHLVMSTTHTIDAGQTIERLTGMFPANERDLIRSRLAQVLRYVVGQRLLPKEGGGRVAALEIMGSSLRTRELIVNGEDEERTFYQIIADAKAHGWQTFDQHITELYRDGLITEEVAKTYCSQVSTVGRAIDMIRNARGEETSSIGDLEMANPERIES